MVVKILKVIDKKKNRQIKPEDVARLHFKDAECYSIMLWDSSLYFKENFEIEFATATMDNVPSPPHQNESLVSGHKFLPGDK